MHVLAVLRLTAAGTRFCRSHECRQKREPAHHGHSQLSINYVAALVPPQCGHMYIVDIRGLTQYLLLNIVASEKAGLGGAKM